MSLEPANNTLRLQRLKKRAHMLEAARSFLRERGLLEVDCPLLSPRGHIDPYIDLIPVIYQKNKRAYLRSSPEYPMKRLLSEGFGDCFQISHVFRDGECGDRHNPEFTMAEWYRIHLSFEKLIEETLEFCSLFTPITNKRILTYRELFKQTVEIDPFTASKQDLKKLLEKNQIELSSAFETYSSLDLQQVIFSLVIEPRLGFQGADIITDFPGELCELATTKKEGKHLIARRFEVYTKGMELANGYEELTCPKELAQRWERAKKRRTEENKETPPVDIFLLKAMEKNFPKCCGVAVGFDRLMMLSENVEQIKEILPFAWEAC